MNDDRELDRETFREELLPKRFGFSQNGCLPVNHRDGANSFFDSFDGCDVRRVETRAASSPAPRVAPS